MKRALFLSMVLAVVFPVGTPALGREPALVDEQTLSNSRTLRIAVVPVNFKEYRVRPTTQARIGNAFFNAPDVDGHPESLSSYWDQSSYGRESMSGDVLALTPLSTFKSCNFNNGDNWIKEVESYWSARGTDLSQYDHVFMVIPSLDCKYGGFAPIPGKWSVINWSGEYWKNIRTNPSLIYILAHEFLHNKGFDHSGVVSCSDENKKVSLGGVCNDETRLVTSLDPTDIMTGNGYLPKWLPTAFQRIALGFIEDEEHVHLAESGTFNVELNPVEFSESATKALVIRRIGLERYVTPAHWSEVMPTSGAPDICIEWHQPSGWFNNFGPKSLMVRGITMRLCDLYSGGIEYQLAYNSGETGFYRAGTRLIDATPGSKKGKADWTDAQLTQGTWTDEFTGITIRVVGFDKLGTDRSQWSVSLEVVIP